MKFTLRRNGHREATIRVTFYVPVDLVDWIVDHSELSRSAAERFVRSSIRELSDGWHTVIADDSRLVEVQHFDSVREMERLGDVFDEYDGPRIIMRGGS